MFIGSALLLAFIGVSPPLRPPMLHVVSGVTGNGAATPLWLAMIRRRLPPERFRAVAPVRKVLTPAEAAWDALVRSRAGAWQEMVGPIADLFAPIAGAADVTIVLGNRGADDAFTHDAQTIGFDLAALQENYGDATSAENVDRIDRFFRHEFTHIMQKPWLRAHPWKSDTPLRAALFDIWAEGLGNYRSLSGKWLPQQGHRSADAARALEQLEPRFVTRLAALACATPAAAAPFLATLSAGKFDQKWGALPAALWLAEESGDVDAALRRLISAGPAGVWDLAARHLSGALQAALGEVKAIDAACARP